MRLAFLGDDMSGVGVKQRSVEKRNRLHIRLAQAVVNHRSQCFFAVTQSRYAGPRICPHFHIQIHTSNNMPTADKLARFIARLEQSAHAQATQEYYHLGATMQENTAATRVVLEALVANEARVLSRVKSVVSKCVGPVFVNGDHVVIRWTFKFEGMDGSIRELEELAYQQWQGERILVEQFFYDPAQFVPKPAPPAG